MAGPAQPQTADMPANAIPATVFKKLRRSASANAPRSHA
jgi:hypothetical protein